MPKLYHYLNTFLDSIKAPPNFLYKEGQAIMMKTSIGCLGEEAGGHDCLSKSEESTG